MVLSLKESVEAQFLVLHCDKVVLRPQPSCLPKVVSLFHLNQKIVLPSFCPKYEPQGDKALHTQDVVCAARCSLKLTAAIRQSDSLCVLLEGSRKGRRASKSTIFLLISQLISQGYGLKSKVPPFSVKAYSTRSVGASWGLQFVNLLPGLRYILSQSFTK